ncbi:MAG: LCP family protein, partial [Chloroflexota bacterium]
MTPPSAGAVTPAVRRRSRYVTAIIDALVPGLGHLSSGRRRLGLTFMLPVLVLLAGMSVVLVTTPLVRLAAELLADDVLVWFIVGQVLVLAWRLLAVGSSLLDARMPRLRRGDALPVALLVVARGAPQAYGLAATQAAREAIDEVFVDPTPTPVAAGPSPTPEPAPSFLATAPPTPSTVPSESPSPTPEIPRVNLLVIGVDSGVGRRTHLTDTMVVVSLDPVTETVSMLSIPRDMVDVPLPDGRRYRSKINSLVAYARNHPRQFPGYDGTGNDVLMDALGTLLRLDIDYYAKVNMSGFVRVVDTLGGVDVNVARSFCDTHYRGYGFTHGFSIKAGRRHLNGNEALAYARVRKPAGESDFTRAARQQEVLAGIRDAIAGGRFLRDPIGLVKALGRTVETNAPRKILPDYAEVVSHVDRSRMFRAVVDHPLVSSGFDRRGSIQIPDVAGIRALASELFPLAGERPAERYRLPAGKSGRGSTGGVAGCAPAATPKPTAAPATPSTDPAASPTPTQMPTPTPGASATTAPPPTPVPTPRPTPTVPPAPPPT